MYFHVGWLFCAFLETFLALCLCCIVQPVHYCKSSRIQRVPDLSDFLHRIWPFMVCPPSRCNKCIRILIRLCCYWIPVFQRDCNSGGSLLLGLVAMLTVLIVSKNPECVGSSCFEVRLLLALLNVSAHSFSSWPCPLGLPVLKLSLGKLHGGASWRSSPWRGDCNSDGHPKQLTYNVKRGHICYICHCQHFLACTQQWLHKLWFLLP